MHLLQKLKFGIYCEKGILFINGNFFYRPDQSGT